MSKSIRSKVGPRGRVTIPVAIQREAGIGEGDEVIVRVIGDGVVQVETPEAVKRCIRSGVPEEELGITREID